MTTAKKSENLKHNYEIKNDSVSAFLDEYEPAKYILNRQPGEVFSRYKEFCERNNYTCIGALKLEECLRECLNYTTEIVQISERHYTEDVYQI